MKTVENKVKRPRNRPKTGLDFGYHDRLLLRFLFVSALTSEDLGFQQREIVSNAIAVLQ